jgi:uncharacterized protein YoxC
MDSFKSGAGILSVVNLVVEISLAIYVVNTVNSLKAGDANTKNELGMIGKKIMEVEGRTVQLANALNELTKTLRAFKTTRDQLIAGVNELHQFKSATDIRLDLIEQNLDLIITALEEKSISVPVPKPKPQSRFARQHMLVDPSEQKVSFRNPISKAKTIEDPEDEEDEDSEAALKEYRKSKR